MDSLFGNICCAGIILAMIYYIILVPWREELVKQRQAEAADAARAERLKWQKMIVGITRTGIRAIADARRGTGYDSTIEAIEETLLLR